jgi:hypothetical protein
VLTKSSPVKASTPALVAAGQTGQHTSVLGSLASPQREHGHRQLVHLNQIHTGGVRVDDDGRAPSAPAPDHRLPASS